MTFKGALQVSLLAHLLDFFLLGGFPTGCSPKGEGSVDSAKHEEKGKHDHDSPKEEIVEKRPEQPTEITLIERTQEEIASAIEQARRQEIAECEPFFGGIGVTYSLDGTISEVHKYYPAYDAGFQKGDRILTPRNEIKGEIGTQVKIEFLRDEELHTVVLMRGRICTKELSAEGKR